MQGLKKLKYANISRGIRSIYYTYTHKHFHKIVYKKREIVENDLKADKIFKSL